MSDSENILQFAQLQSFVSPTFWHKFAEIKLEQDRLSDAPKPIHGFYTSRDAKSCFLEVDYTAFNSNFEPPKYNHVAVGIMYNKNTIEDFKSCDKKSLLAAAGKQLLNDFRTDNIFENPNLLSRFMLLSFADLKTYNYYFWFAFPCPLTPNLVTIAPTRKITEIPELNEFSNIIKDVPLEQQNYFIYNAAVKKYCTLREFALEIDNLNDFYFCFADPSEYEHPSWLLRIYAAFIFYKWPKLIGKAVNFLGLRYNKYMQPIESLLWQVQQNTKLLLDIDDTEVNFVGWEPNRCNKMAPRMVAMRESMDPQLLAENLIQLNLKLMKWRMLPELDLNSISNTKCLLFGAGTLGCAVGRCLLGWGFKHMTFVDNGRVGYSNPTRQCLYTHADAESGKSFKAPTAAKRIKEINPNINAAGHVLQIPMPSHPVGESLQQQTTEDLETIKNLIAEHDVLFLLTDSRESRWLPTLIGADMEKIVITVALGFDSFMVMRHGSTKKNYLNESLEIKGLKCIAGNNLSCYFCTNVTAPGDSLKDRTLDQQCTVSRPGVSNIASSYAVELLVALLQHNKKDAAPAYYSNDGKCSEDIPEGMLGILPHTIRGQLSRFENILPATLKFKQCTACSTIVLDEYRKNGNEFLFKVFTSSKYLEDLTGINEYENLTAEMMVEFEDGMLEMTDEDDDD